MMFDRGSSKVVKCNIQQTVIVIFVMNTAYLVQYFFTRLNASLLLAAFHLAHLLEKQLTSRSNRGMLLCNIIVVAIRRGVFVTMRIGFTPLLLELKRLVNLFGLVHGLSELGWRGLDMFQIFGKRLFRLLCLSLVLGE